MKFETKKIDSEVLAELIELARQSPCRRSHLNMHPRLDDPVQRLLVAMEPDSYVHPHRHPHSPLEDKNFASWAPKEQADAGDQLTITD